MGAALAANALLSLPAAAQADETGAAQAIAIPAGTLAGAIAAFERETGWRVEDPDGAVSARRSPGVAGASSPQAALSGLLAGTGVHARLTGARSARLEVTASGAAAAGEAEDGSVLLDPIILSGQRGSGFQGTPDWVYGTPGSVSVVSSEAMAARGGARNAADYLRDVSGVTAVIDRQDPGLNVNIRGQQDMGRVNMNIDARARTCSSPAMAPPATPMSIRR
ncbi:STN domain-containing protein [Methylobrevis pamukkalensis]|uniref:STN domain-containing protein n=1 Tax=Methylobrevis pamukkalensis TaxID=1439726 RepID=UPI001FDA8DDA|nr:STN domain-containing protein [Methylobrevis pamukkalensis]